MIPLKWTGNEKNCSPFTSRVDEDLLCLWALVLIQALYPRGS